MHNLLDILSEGFLQFSVGSAAVLGEGIELLNGVLGAKPLG
jgi:hypothetical protein